jgi:hypothetical protein
VASITAAAMNHGFTLGRHVLFCSTGRDDAADMKIVYGWTMDGELLTLFPNSAWEHAFRNFLAQTAAQVL